VFFFLSRLGEIALAPLTWVMVLLAAGLLRMRRPRSRTGLTPRRRRARVTRGLWLVASALVLGSVLSLAPVSNGLMRSLERSAQDTTHEDVTYDAVILLGGSVNGQTTQTWGAPQYNESVERVLATFDLLRTGRARAVLVAAGEPGRRLHPDAIEAHVIARQLEAWGIEKERIFVEDRSRNTRENALFSAPIVREQRWKTLVLVTSALHMKRAAGCFRAVGLSFDTYPVDYRSYDTTRFGFGLLPKADQLAASTAAIHEHVGRLVYAMQGYTKE
jgi:uncharacterized SAM-binding protein YcdF (DUF218 family)